MSFSEKKRYSLVDPLPEGKRETPENNTMEGTYRKSCDDLPAVHVPDGNVPASKTDPDDVKFAPEALNGGFEHDGDSGKANGVGASGKQGKGKEKKEKEEKKEKPPMVSMGTLFRYSTGLDTALIIIGTFCAVGHGVAMPLQFLIFGDLITVFTDFFQKKFSNATIDYDKLEDDIAKFSLYYVYLSIGTLVVAYGQMAFWSLTAARQIKQMRLHFFRAILNQDIGWFDCNEPGELNSRLTDDLNKVYDGMGHKVALFIQAITLFLTGFVLGFVYGWKLTLVLLSVTPLLAIAGGLMAKLFTSLTTKELDAYAKAGSIAEEVLSSIRTVAAFGGENKEYERYNSYLNEARDFGIRKGFASGLGLGSFQIIIFGSYALSFWYGSTLIIEKEMKAGDLLIVFFSVMVAATQLGQAGPNLEAVATARGAAHKVFLVIDRVSPVDPSSEEGEKPSSVTGDIEFKDVHFVYPSRDDVKVLTGFNLTADRGQTVALVGESGCGKSTAVKLIQRFYDPQQGQVLIDGRDIRTLNVGWLRQHMGIVSQEPILFATTIAENIRYGQEGISQQEIENATRMANAHDFISQLPQGYETLVGERGAQLSGGQKQRIAIARALVRDPKILLLDEATSALDTESESIVQAALDKARQGRTTIVIAHRLSTVRNADKIAAVQDGVVAEKGTHSELMQTDGVYRQLVTLQTFEEEEKEEEKEDDDDDNGVEDVKEKEAGAALSFMRSMSSLSSDDDHEPTSFERRLSRRASKRLSARKRRPGSALDRQMSDVEEKKHEVVEEIVEPAPVLRILKMNMPEWHYLTAGILAAIGNGAFPLVFALLLSEVLTVFTLNDPDEMEEKATFWSLMFLALGGGSFLCQVIQNAAFAMSGEALTMRLRQMSFKAMMRQSMSYFDDSAHSTGALCTVLATHASDVKGATGPQIGIVVTALATTIGGLIYAFFHSWKLTLVALAFVPFMVVAAALQMKVFIGQGAEKDDSQLESGKVAVEAIENIRTIASLCKEKLFYEKYASVIEKPHRKAVMKAHFYGVSFGMSEAIMFFSNAAVFRFGAYLVAQEGLEFDAMMKVIMVVMISAFMTGHISAFSPDYAKAKIAAARLFKLFDNTTPIDSASPDGMKPDNCQGNVAFTSVRFRYPTRPDVKVLRGLGLKVEPGQRLALVGSSGCGKSTVVSLLERFYDPLEGEVSLDRANLKTLNIQWLRSQMGIVSQEPVLFSYSIAENIAYGDNSRQVSMEEVEAAARAANIHSFINSLPKGYDTNVGDKGTLISGGQKQRVAIARALVRNPQVLLLDEATSALDTESEKVVQEALDKASEGRTTIVIAHRLSTVQNADSIAVIHHGRVVEQGTHQELLALKGTYHSLVLAQMNTGNGDS